MIHSKDDRFIGDILFCLQAASFQILEKPSCLSKNISHNIIRHGISILLYVKEILSCYLHIQSRNMQIFYRIGFSKIQTGPNK